MFYKNFIHNLSEILNTRFGIFKTNSPDLKYNSKKSIYTFLLIFLLACNFILISININKNSDPEAYDTTAYLGEANFIHNHGGLINFPYLCLAGKWERANQHPLYILLLTPFALTDISFFINAKIISGVAGLFFLISLFFLGRKLYGDLPVLIAISMSIL